MPWIALEELAAQQVVKYRNHWDKWNRLLHGRFPFRGPVASSVA
ncbi:hypothetical protein EHYA_07493 [Embleya hyalina]|uniref:Uncharacterized protein n=1 Tax=Embleya hyalina TaxID=516124 RepID=A0A401YYV0_9ACTN|nr:hypothetical protein EHYA_07493 [Embleya hyalina]